jgi:hypothetical protein
MTSRSGFRPRRKRCAPDPLAATLTPIPKQSALAAGPNVEGIPAKIRPEPPKASLAPRAGARNPSRCRVRNTTSRRERGDTGDGEGQLFRPADDPRICGGCPCSPDCVVPPLRGARRLRRVLGLRPSRFNPSTLQRHFVPPKVAQVPPTWRDDTAPRLPFPTGGSG